MAKAKYDDLVKRLGRLRPQDFVQWVCPNLKDVQGVSFEDREFELTHRRVDILYQVATKEAGKFFLHVEFQTQLPVGFPLRLLEYSARIRREVKRPVKTVVIFLKNTKAIRELETVDRCEIGGELINEFHYTKVILPNEPWQALLEKNLPVLYALVPLSQIAEGEESQALGKAVQRIEEVEDTQLRGELGGILYLLGGYRYPTTIRTIVGEKLMQDLMQSETYREAVEAGEVKGEMKALLMILIQRFGNIPKKLQEQLQKTESIEKLNTLLGSAIACASLDEFKAQMK